MAPGPTFAATSGLPPRGDLAGRRRPTTTDCETVSGDGNGWVFCSLGHRHWGRFGAAGILITDGTRVVLQHRAAWTHEGDTWALPGGARDSHEDPIAAALREAVEETTRRPGAPRAVRRVGRRSRRLVVHDRRSPAPRHRSSCRRPTPRASRSRWWSMDEVDALPLHTGFAAAWPHLRRILEPPEPPRSVASALVRVLLPPSEAKSPGGRGRPLAARRTAPDARRGARPGARPRWPSSSPVRRADAAGCAAAPAGHGRGRARRQRARARRSRPRRRCERYAGVVYDGLAAAALDRRRAARRRAHACWCSPACSASCAATSRCRRTACRRRRCCPASASPATFWRPVLDDAMPALLLRGGLVVDLRSSDYAAMWRPKRRARSARRHGPGAVAAAVRRAGCRQLPEQVREGPAGRRAACGGWPPATPVDDGRRRGRGLAGQRRRARRAATAEPARPAHGLSAAGCTPARSVRCKHPAHDAATRWATM